MKQSTMRLSKVAQSVSSTIRNTAGKAGAVCSEKFEMAREIAANASERLSYHATTASYHVIDAAFFMKEVFRITVMSILSAAWWLFTLPVRVVGSIILTIVMGNMARNLEKMMREMSEMEETQRFENAKLVA
jgi:hypothetical protein